MHTVDKTRWQHEHQFDEGNPMGERNTRLAVALTAGMMIMEIVAGIRFNSMALLADGWHMATHVTALGITAFAFWYARRHAKDARFAFGTGKVSVLAGYSSAVLLGVVALYMASESVLRIFNPKPIHYNEALWVAVIGLAVNLICAFLLKEGHSHAHHDHEDHSGHHHGHHHHGDLNLRAAYLHVLADALTSVLAIVALIGGKINGWGWLDPVMGIVGAVIVSRWAYGLLKDTSRILLDREMDSHVVKEVQDCLENDGDTILVDLHVWRVGGNQFAGIVSLVSSDPRTPEHYKEKLKIVHELKHITVEIFACSGSHQEIAEEK